MPAGKAGTPIRVRLPQCRARPADQCFDNVDHSCSADHGSCKEQRLEAAPREQQRDRRYARERKQNSGRSGKSNRFEEPGRRARSLPVDEQQDRLVDRSRFSADGLLAHLDRGHREDEHRQDGETPFLQRSGPRRSRAAHISTEGEIEAGDDECQLCNVFEQLENQTLCAAWDRASWFLSIQNMKPASATKATLAMLMSANIHCSVRAMKSAST